MFPKAELDGQVYRDSNSASQKGHTPWNKGLTKESDARIARYADVLAGIEQPLYSVRKDKKVYTAFACQHLRGRHLTEEHKAAIGESSKNRIWSEESRQRSSLAHLGQTPMLGKSHSLDTRQRIAESVAAYIENLPLVAQKERIRKWRGATGLSPNQSEMLLDDILQRNFPGEWKYVGGGDFVLGGKIPDFLNMDGKKQLMELYGNYWHQGDNPQTRIDYFRSFGFSTLVIWEHELQSEIQQEVIQL